MTVEQIIDIPADHRVFLEFMAPKEIPAGPAKVELKVTPVIKKKDQIIAGAFSQGSATPLTDALSGILSHVCDISIEEIRAERLAKYQK